jgi:UPF0271 protein
LPAAFSYKPRAPKALTALEEGFADRGYAGDGQLVERGTPGAHIEDAGAMLAQVLSMVKRGIVMSRDGALCRLHVDTICLHGDAPHALEFARAIRAQLQHEGIDVAPCAVSGAKRRLLPP